MITQNQEVGFRIKKKKPNPSKVLFPVFIYFGIIVLSAPFINDISNKSFILSLILTIFLLIIITILIPLIFLFFSPESNTSISVYFDKYKIDIDDGRVIADWSEVAILSLDEGILGLKDGREFVIPVQNASLTKLNEIEKIYHGLSDRNIH